MPLPTNLSSAEQLQDVALKLTNKRVRNYFRDVGNDDWEPNLDTDRARLRVACTHQEKDSLLETICRLQLFNIELGASLEDLGHFYGIPTANYHESFDLKPQVKFIFQEKAELAKKKKRRPLVHEASFRLMGETTSSITQAKIDQLENRIRTQFPKTYLFKAGRFTFSYYNNDTGFRTNIRAYSVAEARELLTKLNNVSGTEIDWSKFKKTEWVQKNFEQQDFVTVLGKRKKLPQRRSITECYLNKVELTLHGNLKDIYLYHRIG